MFLLILHGEVAHHGVPREAEVDVAHNLHRVDAMRLAVNGFLDAAAM